MRKALPALLRLAHGLAHAVRGLLVIVFRFPTLAPEQRALRVQLWASRMLQILGIALVVNGTPPVAGPVLLVANHISWLDILVMHAARHCRFVSKSAVRSWPLIGRLATGAGTLYIQRESRRDAGRLVEQMSESLRNGDVVAVFPEGTTGDGRAILPFYGNLLQSAIKAPAPVQPVGLRFVDARTGETSFAPSYVNDETLAGSLWRTLTAPGIVARVNFGEPVDVQGQERRALARTMQSEVDRLRRL
jgi:1-acyl-sn-glycerol-3-phosphate acyltransferase